MNLSSLKRITPAEVAGYDDLLQPTVRAVWPTFMLYDTVALELWPELYERFSIYQFAFLDPVNDAVVGLANSVPLAWDGPPEELPNEGWDWALTQAVDDHNAQRRARIQCAIQIAIAPAFQGKGLSAQFVTAMRSIGIAAGLNGMIAPVRPSRKSLYPLTPIERYITWQNDAKLPFDPWLRVHARLGARIIRACPQAMTIRGSISNWESWAGMKFPESGAYVVPGALVPVAIDVEADEGIYVEPNVWMAHPAART